MPGWWRWRRSSARGKHEKQKMSATTHDEASSEGAPSAPSEGVAPEASDLPQPVASSVHDEGLAEEGPSLAFTGGSAETDARYLATLMAVGATDARAYKDLSYQLLDLHEGLRVLDVGCGIGVDLPYLSAAVGPQGEVIGLDRNAELVERAKQYLQEARAVEGAGAIDNVQLVAGEAENIPLPDGSVERVRTDRAMQHFSDPVRAVAEIWRVLKPGGIVTLVEPDWGMMAVYPGGAGGGDDDSAFSHILTAMRQSVAHPLLGRQLHALLHGLGPTAWSRVQVQVVTFGLTDWEMVDPILELSSTVEIIGGEQPTLRAELEAWLTALHEAARAGTFFAMIPLIFATAWKAEA